MENVLQLILVFNFFSGSKTSKVSACFFTYSSIVLVYFLKAFPKGEYINLACSIILVWSDGNISSPLKYQYLSIFQDDAVDIFTASLLPLIWVGFLVVRFEVCGMGVELPPVLNLLELY